RHTRWPRDWSSDVCSSDLICTPHIEAMAKMWGVQIGATTIRKHVQILGAQAQRQQERRTQRALDPCTRPQVLREAQAKAPNALRSEERRVGKEGRSEGGPE